MNTAPDINSIPTEITHQGTTHQKRLVPPGGSHGRLETMNYAWLEPGNQLASHIHPDGEEFYLFLEGSGEILVDTVWSSVSIGSFVTVPPQTEHSVRNTSDERLVFITLRTVESE